MGRSYSRAPTPTRQSSSSSLRDGGASSGPPPLPRDSILSALDEQQRQLQAEEDAVTQGIEQEFERRLARAVKRKYAAPARPSPSLAVNLYSEDESSHNSGADDNEDDFQPQSAAGARVGGGSRQRSASPQVHARLQRPSSAPQTRSAFSRSLPSHPTSATDRAFNATQPRAFSQHLTGYTQTNRAKRLSQRQGIVSHWPGHGEDGPMDTPNRRDGDGTGADSPQAQAQAQAAQAQAKAEAEAEANVGGVSGGGRARNASISNLSQSSPRGGGSRSLSPRRDSTLLHETRAHILRMKAYGIPRGTSPPEGAGGGGGGYHSDGDGASLTSKGAQSVRAQRRASKPVLEERRESERFGIWHPRYRVPQKTFGHSKPFLYTRGEPEASTADVPLFDKFVRRLRDGFEKLPTRGTFTRAAKGLKAEWYPMDWDSLEAVRRQGYFHDVIGDIQKYSYRDLRSMEGRSARPDLSASVDTRSGKTVLTPTKSGAARRATMAMHQSRQYKTVDGLRDTEPADEFTDWRKWNPQLWSKYGNNTNAASFEPGVEVDGLQGESSPRKTAPSRASILDGSFSFQRGGQEMSVSIDSSDIRVASASSWPRSMQQPPHQQQQQYPAARSQSPAAAAAAAAPRQSWGGMVQQSAAELEEKQQREEKQLLAYLSWSENAYSQSASSGKCEQTRLYSSPSPRPAFSPLLPFLNPHSHYRSRALGRPVACAGRSSACPPARPGEPPRASAAGLAESQPAQQRVGASSRAGQKWGLCTRAMRRVKFNKSITVCTLPPTPPTYSSR